ncbi:MAG: hypothetical protein N2643_03845 [Endomicrobia bacterium]|nr:hypothetical protein [Endomicrobiia bacterium]
MKNLCFIFFLSQKINFYKLFTLIYYFVFCYANVYTIDAKKVNKIVNNTNYLHMSKFYISKVNNGITLTNFPNPFKELTQIYIKLPETDSCKVFIYSLFGYLIKEFDLNGSNEYIFSWDGTNEASQKVSSGGYICVLHYKSYIIYRKIGFYK